jgi:hypothetical protein
MLVHSLDLTPDSDDLMDSFDELFLTCMLFELYLHVYLHLCTSHMARRKTASCHAKATPKPRSIMAWSRQRSLQRRLLRRFKSGVACIRGLLVSSRAHAAESIQLYTSGIPLASDMQPRSHPSPPRITRCLFVRRPDSHTTPHSTRPGSAQVHNATNRDYHGDASANGCFSPQAQ